MNFLSETRAQFFSAETNRAFLTPDPPEREYWRPWCRNADAVGPLEESRHMR
jgi:hypothetical protein